MEMLKNTINSKIYLYFNVKIYYYTKILFRRMFNVNYN